MFIWEKHSLKKMIVRGLWISCGKQAKISHPAKG